MHNLSSMSPAEVLLFFSFITPESRRDPVAVVCGRLALRVDCCPCLQNLKGTGKPCIQCIHDIAAIVKAFDAPIQEPIECTT